MRRGALEMGSLGSIIAAAVVLGLLALGIWWVASNLGRAGGEYGRGMARSVDRAVVVQCQANLRTIWQFLQLEAASKGKFPASLEALGEIGGGSEVLHCPTSASLRYVYVRGQNPDGPGSNIIVFEPEGVHGGRCCVLRVSGQIEMLTPEEIQAVLAKMRDARR